MSVDKEKPIQLKMTSAILKIFDDGVLRRNNQSIQFAKLIKLHLSFKNCLSQGELPALQASFLRALTGNA